VPSAFVNDGYTLPGKIPGVPGLYPAAKFLYRPDAGPIRDRYVGLRGPERTNCILKAICDQTTEVRFATDEAADEWSEPVKLTPKVAAKLHAGLRDGIMAVVLGYEGPDLNELESMEVRDAVPNSPTGSG
jgi:hypothetical protein